MTDAPRIEFRILGPLEVEGTGGPVRVEGPRRRALLALLLVHARTVVSVERIVEELWRDEPPASPANAVQALVSLLRKSLAAAGAGGLLVTQAPGYRLDVPEGALDAERFEQLVARGRERLAAGDASAARAALVEADGLWRGPPLADFAYDEFAQAPAARFEELRVAATEDRIEAELALGRHAALTGELDELVAANPLRERLWEQLMVALYRSGRQADALDAYRRARTALVETAGIEPGQRLRELERAVLAQAPELGAPAPVAPPAVAPTPPLPVPATKLVGREDAVAEAAALLARDDVRLVTLTGPGGIGKTRLAIELARTLGPSFADGARFVALASVADAEAVAPAIADAAGAAPGQPAADALRDRHLLLVLDNFEQVTEAAPVVADLLAAAPRVQAVVTSRAVLRIAAEHELPVAPLPGDDARALFAQRAAAVDRAFDVEAHAAAVDALCARLDHLPLAIELAAARVKLLPPQSLLERLTSSLDLAAGRARDLPERQQTLRGTIDWSYRLLEPGEQRLFAELAVFVGGATLEAIEAVCSAGANAIDPLETLLDNSLVRRSDGGDPRFGMLATIREYARERLADDDDVRRRHAGWYLELAASAEEELEGERQDAWARRLELEHPNIRAALAWALDAGDHELAVRGASALRRFWHVHGHLVEGRRWLEAALATGAGSDAVRSRAANGAAFLAADQGDLDAAQRHFEESAALAKRAGDDVQFASVTTNLGNVVLFRGGPREALPLYEAGLAIFRRLGNHRKGIPVLENLGLAHVALGNFDAAVPLLEEAVETARRNGARRHLAASLRSLARTYVQLGDAERARPAIAESVGLAHDLRDPQGVADALEVVGGIAAGDGDFERTVTLFAAAEALRAAIGARRHADQVDWYERVVEAARDALGEERAAAAAARGAQLSLDDAVALALADD